MAQAGDPEAERCESDDEGGYQQPALDAELAWASCGAKQADAFRSLDHLAQDGDRAHVANVEQRRQAEEDGGEDSGGQRGGDGLDGQGEWRTQRQKRSEERREDVFDAEAEGYADESSGEAEEDGLEQVDAQDVGRACADGLHDGEDFNALLQVGAHGHGDADGSEDHGDETDEAEESGGVVEAASELGTGLAEVGDLRVREYLSRARDGGCRCPGLYRLWGCRS